MTSNTQISSEMLLAIRERLQKGDLSETDRLLLVDCLDLLLGVQDQLLKKTVTIAKLRDLLFGPSTEKKADKKSPGEASRRARKSPSPEQRERRRGRGRLGADDYPNAQTHHIAHGELCPGDNCPLCIKGRLYCLSPARQIHLKAESPLKAACYHLERLRCAKCQAVFTASEPARLAKWGKYDPTTAAMICLLKYGAGLPLHRLDRLQSWLSVPMPSSTQFDLIESLLESAMPAYRHLLGLAANAPLLYVDDTRVRILSLMAENDQGRTSRKGMHTTAIVAISQDLRILLFQSGRNHAGENLATLLKDRSKNLPPPIQMADALSHNFDHEHQTIEANCLTHGRRGFYALEPTFPKEVGYILGKFARVYAIDAETRRQAMCPGKRLAYHQRHSGPTMSMLKTHLFMILEERVIEPNSAFGVAASYMLKHWDRLTSFLRVPGAPIDNSLCERAIKKHVLVRKNSLFYKNLFGALAGDVMLSLIHTCAEMGENPFDYLTALHTHADAVARSPGAWLPWTFRESLAAPDADLAV